MPRKRHVSRNEKCISEITETDVMPRKRHVSRNPGIPTVSGGDGGHASQEACE